MFSTTIIPLLNPRLPAIIQNIKKDDFASYDDAKQNRLLEYIFLPCSRLHSYAALT